jgi:surface polysaccharide O-acyltransferase-like enzyme
MKEYPIKLKKVAIFPLWMLLVVAFGAFNFYRSRGGIFSWGKYTDWYSLPVTLMAILAFAFLSNIKSTKYPKFIKVSLKYLSDISFGAYLLSYIADSYIYSKFNLDVPQPLQRIWWFVPVVLIIASLSLAGSAVINLVWTLLEKLTKFIFSKIKNRKNKNKQPPDIENTNAENADTENVPLLEIEK